MARIGVSITKSVTFRGATQEFSNVYYYQGGTLPDASGADAIIDAIVAAEKSWHSTVVTFVRGRLWSQEGSPAANNMISQKNLSGTGTQNADASLDRERAYLFRIRAGVDVRGNPVYLRKWYHSCGVFDVAVGLSAALTGNTGAFSSGQRTTMSTKVDGLKNLSQAGGGWSLCAKGGRNFNAGENFLAHQYLEHHQLGDQWRAQ